MSTCNDETDSTTTKLNGLGVLSCNARGIKVDHCVKANELQKLIDNSADRINVVCIQETKLSEKVNHTN